MSESINREQYLALIREINQIEENILTFYVPEEIRKTFRYPNNRDAYLDTPIFAWREELAAALLPDDLRTIDGYSAAIDAFVEACGTGE